MFPFVLILPHKDYMLEVHDETLLNSEGHNKKWFGSSPPKEEGNADKKVMRMTANIVDPKAFLPTSSRPLNL